MQQTRIFLLTNEPRLLYYTANDQFRGEIKLERTMRA